MSTIFILKSIPVKLSTFTARHQSTNSMFTYGGTDVVPERIVRESMQQSCLGTDT
jgi:hypothetical protein